MQAFSETADIETSSEGYASRFASRAGQWMLKVQEQGVRHLLAGAGQGTILDVGGGHGQITPALVSDGYAVTVIGSAPECAARIQSTKQSGSVTFVVGDLVNLPFESGAFDTVICLRLVPHCTAWRKLISELCRVVKGRVIIDYPTSQSINCISPALFGAKKAVEKNTRPYTLFTHAEIREAFKECGFVQRARIGQFVLPMVVHRMINSPRISGFVEGVCGALGLSALCGSPVLASFERVQ